MVKNTLLATALLLSALALVPVLTHRRIQDVIAGEHYPPRHVTLRLGFTELTIASWWHDVITLGVCVLILLTVALLPGFFTGGSQTVEEDDRGQ